MKYNILFLSIFLSVLISDLTMTQDKLNIPLVSDVKEKSYPIDGTLLLQEEYENTAKYLREHPQYLSQKQLRKTEWAFTIGSTKTWWSFDFTTWGYFPVTSTCRAVNDQSYIFVKDSDWGVTVNQAAVDSVSKAFEQSTPADNSRGIYRMDVDVFGDPPDVDSDPRIIILLQDIKDGFFGGAFVAGYFNPHDQTNQLYSNEAEIFYVDCNPVNLTNPDGLSIAMGTIAHEFQHMLNWNYHKINPELTFINEGLSQLATDQCGYPLDFDSYSSEVNKFLFSWKATSDILNDYSRAARFFVYLRDQFGIGLFKRVVKNSVIGVEGLQNALATYGVTKPLDSIFVDWCVANALNNRNDNPAFGYNNKNISQTKGIDVPYPVVNSANQLLYNYGVTYLNYTYGSNLKITFNATNANLTIKAVEQGDSAIKIVDVQQGKQFSEPLFGSVYNSIQFIIVNSDLNNYALYSYQSTADLLGETELKWDINEPISYYDLTPKDTVCVLFNAFKGGILDSIRIALRRPGSITGGIWKYSEQISPTPLGAPLHVPITASISTETPLPYPKPYQNWASIDLTPYSISSNDPFVVGFVIGSNPGTPGVMVSYYPGNSPRYSYAYLQASDKNSLPGWYYFTNPEGDSVSLFLIRAYVHSTQTGVSQEIELAPSDFTLTQNYPNPFNPSTTIRYSIPTNSHVTLKIFNLLGKEVTTVVDETLAAGKYTVTFNASNLASGVYYYRIEAGSFKEVKKMVLIR